MEISGSNRPIDPVLRKRQQTEAAAVRANHSTETPRRNDAVVLGDTSPAAIARYVGILKSMNPADLHKVEELRARIADGSFTATPDELADSLSNLLDRDDR
jgi:anti-sigma28 factor (negative regulator of flagellin synthesis)